MRVLLLTHVFSRAADDPLGAFLLHLIQGMGNRAQVYVLAPHAPGLAERETLLGIPISRFRYASEMQETLAYTGVMHQQVARGIGGKSLFGRFLRANLSAAITLARRTKPDIIHAHWWLPGGFIGAIVSRVTRTPLIITTHGTDVQQLVRTRWASNLARFAFSRASATTCGSTFLRNQLLDLNVANADRVTVIPMPVNPIFLNNSSGFSLNAQRSTLNASSDAHHPSSFSNLQSPVSSLQSSDSSPPSSVIRRSSFVVLTVSRLSRQKSIDTLINAVALLRERGINAQLKIAGDGDQRAALEQLVHAQNLTKHVQFLGMVPQTALPALYAACDAFVLPSIREGMGLVLAEALLCGAPVIATNSGGVTDIVQDKKTGLVFPERDTNALANALEQYARDPIYAARLAAEGRARVLARFTPDQVADQFLKTYAAALAQ
jgi:glycosyltransferase involved in cell wall biosynthesis